MFAAGKSVAGFARSRLQVAHARTARTKSRIAGGMRIDRRRYFWRPDDGSADRVFPSRFSHRSTGKVTRAIRREEVGTTSRVELFLSELIPIPCPAGQRQLKLPGKGCDGMCKSLTT